MIKKIIAIFLVFILTAGTTPAYEVVPVAGDNYSYLFNIYGQDESLGIEVGDKPLIGVFNILNNYRLPLYMSGKAWASIINSTATDPATYSIISENEYNAAAASSYTQVAESPYRVIMVNARINGLTPIGEPDDDFPTDGIIFVGLGIDEEYPGWAPFTGYHALNHSDISDFNSVMMHEFMHSLGVTSGVGQISEDSPYYFSEDGEPLTIFDKNLRIYQGDPSDPFDLDDEIIPQEGMTVGEDEEFDVFNYSPYFVGENTIKVLGGDDDYDDARQAIIDNGGFTNYSSYYSKDEYPQVYGLPIHPADSDDEIDLSHLELHNSYMSHQMYRNWLIPMEAELAVLKDVGYDIDLRKHFGQSYYLNDIDDTYTQGFSDWDGSSYTGTPSQTVQAVGIHIYGNDNTITQASDILTGGEGSFGVRIDGKDNEYILKSGHLIQSNGKENLGLAVTWGSGHSLTVESGSSITAAAEDGIAASFDFGANLFGLHNTPKGSYINYNSNLDMDVPPDDDNTTALVSKFDVAGNLTGGKAAIYISDNAHVENINLLDGASINGDIISKWNSVSSGPDEAHVQIYNGSSWQEVDPEDIAQIYFTNINVNAGDSVSVNGVIDGSNDVFNTLKMNNAGDLTVNGDTINVYSLGNTGSLTLAKADLNTQTGEINGNGTIYITQELNLGEDMDTVENTISLSSGALLSTLNNKTQNIEFDTLKSYGGKISFDLGDTFDIQNDDVADAASLHQIKVAQENVDLLANDSYTLFDSETLDFGTSSANVYYNGNRYTFTQDTLDPQKLSISAFAGGAELGNAAADATAANFIVTDGVLTQDAGTVYGDMFEISGNDIDVNGHNGLVIDEANNAIATVLYIGISGAADSDLTVQNGGNLLVDASQKGLTLGQTGETALTLSNAEVALDSNTNHIIVSGGIQGTNNATDIIHVLGRAVQFDNVSNATLRMSAQHSYITNNTANTVFELQDGKLHVANDYYLSASANNEIVAQGGEIDLINGQATDINLAKMTLQNDLNADIDVDLNTMTADRFVFQNSADLDAQSRLLNITGVQFIAPHSNLTNESYIIPFVSADFHNENLLGGVQLNLQPYTLQTSIFRYNISFEQNDTYAGLLVARGSSNDYKSYNPEVLTTSVAAQASSYLGQLNTNQQIFTRMNMDLPDSLQAPAPKAEKSMAAGEGFYGKLPEKNVPIYG